MPDVHPASPPPAHAPGAGTGASTARCKPTGRRTLTPAKLAALDHPPPRPGGPGRGEVFAAFCRAAPTLGVILLRPFVELLISRSFSQDWTGETRPMVWVSNQWLCARLGVGEGRLKQLIGLAFEAGLIAMREAGNGHRRGRREEGEGGRILWAYGFDLSPLAARCAEFRDLADAFERREALARQLRAELSGLRRDVLTLADLGRTTAADAADWTNVAYRARQVAGQGRGQQDTDVLQMLVGQLVAMRDEARATLEPLCGSDTTKSDPKGRMECPLNTATTQPETIGKNASADEQVQSRPPASLSATEASDPLRGFPATPAFVLAVAPPFRGFVPNARPSRDQVVEAASQVRGHLGISQDAWGEACLTFGRWEAAVALAAVAARHAVGEVHSPGGLLRKMLKLHGEGELRLDRTLRGLAARLADATAGSSRPVTGLQAPSSLPPHPATPPPPEAADDAASDEGTPAPHRARKSFDDRVREALAKAQQHAAGTPPTDARPHEGTGPAARTGLGSGRRGTTERRR